MENLILKIFALMIITIGVISICDARELAKKFFSNSDRNTSTIMLKIGGFIIAMIGILVVYIFI